ncbi:uncharacterized protein BKCO1_5000018 [Diplodia corticola]|uniref:TLC domain-containing protein n=1 Tax=Diplodia corticola TaxID=236234 RepID=A0A1J9RUV9_9PEZI|nr:uncharacterized protein BKCO1_5000018 [Diplodia corticola]OJD31285.1 hypothetical protein BKCO1_5000018 [Diplodia corticola]
MLDPFPFAAPAALQHAVKPFADYMSFKTLPLHIHELLFAVLLYHITNTVISPWLSTRLFPNIYPQFNKRTRINWDVHVVSLVQSTLINALALWVSYVDNERAEMDWEGRVWGYTGASGLIVAFSCGYFVWDLWISLRYVKVFGLGLLAHAVSALSVYSFGFRPFVNFYAPTFILYELSSPFLNIHWFCDKLNMTGSKLQLYNGFCLLGTFFAARLCWGTYQSYHVFADIYRAVQAGGLVSGPGLAGLGAGADSATVEEQARPTAETMRFAEGTEVPVWLAATYLAANLTLNSLNFFWFNKMIETVRKRFQPPLGTMRPEKEHEKKAKRDEDRVFVEGIDVETDEEVQAVASAIAANASANGGADETVVARGLYDDGRRTIEVAKTEVRNRRRG